MIPALVWAAGGASALMLLYQNLRVRWPESYFAPAESLAYFVSRTGPRFIIFRTLPPYFVFLGVGLYGPEPSSRTVWLCALFYVIASTTLSVLASVRSEPDSVPLTVQRIMVLIATSLGILGCAWLAQMTVPHAVTSAPKISDVLANLISAVLAATLAVSFLSATRSDEPAGRRLNSQLMADIEAVAIECCVDPSLATAIAQAEHEQRPPWFRRLEGSLYRFRRGGTYGLFQVSGFGPVDDLQSCRIALTKLVGAWPLLNENGMALEWSISKFAEQHNPDSGFAERVCRQYREFFSRPLAQAGTLARDYRAVVDLWSVGRFRERLRARGTYWSTVGPISVHTRSLETDAWIAVDFHILQSPGARDSWWADIPERSVEIQLSWGRHRANELLILDLRGYGVVRRELALRETDATPPTHVSG